MNPLERLWNSTADLYKRFNLDAPIKDRQIKFDEEVKEFKQEIRAIVEHIGGSGDALVEEAVDVIVTTIGILQKFGVDIDDLMEKIELVALKNDAKTHETHVIWNGLITKRSKIQKEPKTRDERGDKS